MLRVRDALPKFPGLVVVGTVPAVRYILRKTRGLCALPHPKKNLAGLQVITRAKRLKVLGLARITIRHCQIAPAHREPRKLHIGRSVLRIDGKYRVERFL